MLQLQGEPIVMLLSSLSTVFQCTCQWNVLLMVHVCRLVLMWICRTTWATQLCTKLPTLEERYASLPLHMWRMMISDALHFQLKNLFCCQVSFAIPRHRLLHISTLLLSKLMSDDNLKSDFIFPPPPSLWTLKEIVLLLLRYDACANIINGTAQIPKDVTEDDEIITMLEGMASRGVSADGFLITVEQFMFFHKLLLLGSPPPHVQLQKGGRRGGGRRCFWKRPERGTSLLCLNWCERLTFLPNLGRISVCADFKERPSLVHLPPLRPRCQS